MTIQFKQLGIIDEMPGRIFLETGGITVYQLIKMLEKQYGFLSDKIINRDKKLNRQLVILINGVSIDKTGGLDTVIHDGDKILLTVLVSGG